MLVAYTEQNERFVLNSSIPQTTLQHLRMTTKFFCPQCKQQLQFKIGSLKIPHFAHYSKSNCELNYSEKESERHLLGKEHFYQLFQYLKLHVELEPYLPMLKQRPDLLVIQDSGCRFAIEFQCSPILVQLFEERNKGYKGEHIIPKWIPATPSKILNSGIQKVTLNQFYQQFITATEHHPYIMSYNPTIRQFIYVSNLMYLHGNSFLSKVQALPLMKQKFPFYTPQSLTKDEFKQYLVLFNAAKHKYLNSRVLISRKGVNDLFLRSVYELRLNIKSLPNHIGIPIKGSESLNIFAVEWQVALFYFMYITRISVKNLKGNSIYLFLRWAKLPETNMTFSVVQNYCELLKSLSIQHAHQIVSKEELFLQLYTHFLAIED